MSGFKKLNVVPEDMARDLQTMVREWRVTNGFRRSSSQRPFEKLPDVVETTKVVVLIGRPVTDERISAIELQLTDSIVYDVNLTGLYGLNDAAEDLQTFPIQVYQNGATARIVDIPFQATAEEFHAACGFDSSVKVWLGAYLYSSNDTSGNRASYSEQRYPLFRWLVDVGNSGWSVGYVEPSMWIALSGTGSPNINRTRFTGTDRWITVNQPIPPTRWISRTPVYADFTIDWDADLERWVVTLKEEPADGSVLAAVWDEGSDSWIHANVTSIATWYYNTITYPSAVGDPIFLMEQQGEDATPVEEIPSGSVPGRRRVSWIYLNNEWKEIYTELTTVQRAHLFGMWGYGYAWGNLGGVGGYGYNWWAGLTSGANGWSSPGCFALAHKSGSQWLLSNIETRAFSFVQV
jgi:hypothetical protein